MLVIHVMVHSLIDLEQFQQVLQRSIQLDYLC